MVVKKTQTEILEILLIQMIKNQVVFRTTIITSLKESQSYNILFNSLESGPANSGNCFRLVIKYSYTSVGADPGFVIKWGRE